MNIDKKYEIERIDTLRGTVRAHMQNDIFTMRMLCTLQNKEISILFDLLDNYRRILSSELNKEQEAKTIINKWHKNPLGDYSRLHCPWCDRELDIQSAKEYVACPYCGRKVKWNESR